jgi:hemoglobin
MAALVGVMGLGLAAGCESWPECLSGKPCAKEQKSLYDRLGGEAAISAVVEDFVGRAAGNPEVNFTRKGTASEWQATDENVALLKKRLVQFVWMATGGPQKYEGRDMKTAHKGMAISNEEFDALGSDLAASLDKFKVPKQEKDELLAIVETTRASMIERK